MDTSISIKADTTGLDAAIRKTKTELNKLGRAANDTGKKTQQASKKSVAAMSRTKRATAAARKEMQKMKRATGGLRGVFASIGLVLFAKNMINVSDTMRLMQGRLKLVTTSAENLAETQKKLLDISITSRSSFEESVKLFTRMSIVSDNLGKSQSEMLEITEAVNKALVISGANTMESIAATRQFAQALGAGVLAGDELRSILENAPRLSIAVARGLGTTVDKLKILGSEGKLVSKEVASALLKELPKLRKEFELLPVTVGQSMEIMRSKFLFAMKDLTMEEVIISIEKFTQVITSPGILNGLQMFTAGLFNVVGILATLTSEITKAGDAFGRELAKLFISPMGDIAKLDEELFDLQTRLGNTFVGRYTATLDFIPDVFFEERISELEKKRDALLKGAGFKTPSEKAAEAAKKAPTKDRPFGKIGGGKGPAGAAKETAAEKLLSGLQKENLQLSLNEKQFLAYKLAVSEAGPEVSKLALSLFDSNKALEAEQTAIEKAKELQEELVEQKKENTVSDLELIETLHEEVLALSRTTEENEKLNNVRQLSTDATTAQKKRVTELTAARQAAEAQIKAQTEAEDLLKKKQEELDAIAGDFSSTLASGFTDAITGANSLSDALDNIGKKILDITTRELIEKPLEDAISGTLKGSNIFTEIFGGTPKVQKTAAPGGGAPAAVAGALLPSITGEKTAGSCACEALESVPTQLSDSLDSFFPSDESPFNAITEKASSFFESEGGGLFSNITDLASSFFSGSGGGGNGSGILSSIGGFFSDPGSVFDGFFGTLSGLATGGFAKQEEPVIVGERGPELFVPQSSGTVVPNHKLFQPNKEVPPMTVVNNINIAAPEGRISRESMGQLQSRMGASMKRSLGRNG